MPIAGKTSQVIWNVDVPKPNLPRRRVWMKEAEGILIDHPAYHGRRCGASRKPGQYLFIKRCFG